MPNAYDIEQAKLRKRRNRQLSDTRRILAEELEYEVTIEPTKRDDFRLTLNIPPVVADMSTHGHPRYAASSELRSIAGKLLAAATALDGECESVRLAFMKPMAHMVYAPVPDTEDVYFSVWNCDTYTEAAEKVRAYLKCLGIPGRAIQYDHTAAEAADKAAA